MNKNQTQQQQQQISRIFLFEMSISYHGFEMRLISVNCLLNGAINRECLV